MYTQRGSVPFKNILNADAEARTLLQQCRQRRFQPSWNHHLPVHLEGSVPDVVPYARAMHYRVVNAELGEDSVEVPLHRPHPEQLVVLWMR